MTFDTPIYLPFTGDLLSRPVGQSDPESTLTDQARHDSGAMMYGFLGMMTKRTSPFFQARQRGIKVGTRQRNHINYDAHV